MKLLAVLTLLAMSLPARAWAGSCCGETLMGDRLQSSEVMAATTTSIVEPRVGSFDGEGEFHGLPEGTTDLRLAQRIGVVARVTERLELGAAWGAAVNLRQTNRASEVGGGSEDLRATGRALLVDGIGLPWVPNLSLMMGVLIPVGVAVPDPDEALATSVTGQGAAELTQALSVDEVIDDRVLLRGDLGIGWFVPESRGGERVQRSPRLFAALQAGVLLDDVGLHLTSSIEQEAPPSGAPAGTSSRRRVDLGLLGVLSISRAASLSASISTTPPIDYLGQHQPATLSAGLGLRVSASQ